jgi:hypothetical protein
MKLAGSLAFVFDTVSTGDGVGVGDIVEAPFRILKDSVVLAFFVCIGTIF